MSNTKLASKRTVSETITLVYDAPTSIFSKEDVLKLLQSIDTENTGREFTEAMSEDLIDFVTGAVGYISASDVIDSEDAMFILQDGNVIKLDESSLELDTDYINDSICDAISEWCDRNVL